MEIVKEPLHAGSAVKPLVSHKFSWGDPFDRLVSTMFPNNDFDLLQVTPKRYDINDRVVEEPKDPDFQIRHRRTGHVFWIECRYRREAFCGRVNWCNSEQLKLFREFQAQIEPQMVYIVIGLGGWAKVPEQIFLFPLSEASYTSLPLTTLKRFEHRCGTPFKYAEGRLH
jgi:hypothetical protein